MSISSLLTLLTLRNSRFKKYFLKPFVARIISLLAMQHYFSGFLGTLPNIEVSSMQFSQGVDFPLTQKDTCTLSGQLQTQNGTGAGGVNISWRHLFSHKSWAEIEMTAGRNI